MLTKASERKLLIMKNILELKNDVKRLGKFLKDKNNNVYEIVIYNGHNCLLTIPKENNSLCNLIYNKDFDCDSDYREVKLDNYLSKQWDIIIQYIK